MDWKKTLGDGGLAFGELLKTNRIGPDIDLSYLCLNRCDDKTMATQIPVRIAQALKSNTSLKTLNLVASQITPEGAMAFVEAFQVNKTFEELSLISSEIISDGGLALAALIKTNRIGETVSFSNATITTALLSVIFEALNDHNTTTVQHLYFSGCTIGNDGMMFIAEALKANKNLSSVAFGKYLANEFLSPACTRAFVEALKVNTTLERLNLVWSEIINDGGLVLAELIRTNRIGARLDFLGSISTAVMSRVFEALEMNTTVKELSLLRSEIDHEKASLIIKALQSNLIVLESIELTIDARNALLIAQALENNRTVKKILFYLYAVQDEKMIADCLLKNDVLLECFLGLKNFCPQERTDFWHHVRADGYKYYRLFQGRGIDDCGAEMWRFTRALFRARKE